MNRRTFALGLGVALAFAAVPAAAQTVLVDVGVHAGPVSGRVVYGAPPVYHVPHPPYGGYSAHDREHARRHFEYEREYWKDVREFERERAKAHREYERERLKDLREAEREHRKWQREREREYRKHAFGH